MRTRSGSLRPEFLTYACVSHHIYYDWALTTFASVSGSVTSEKDKCPQCRGNRVVQEKKILEVNVEKGMQHNQKIVFQGEADEAVRRGFLPARLVLHADALSWVLGYGCIPEVGGCSLRSARFAVLPTSMVECFYKQDVCAISLRLRKRTRSCMFTPLSIPPPRLRLVPPQPDTIPGDIVFVVQQKEHAIFKRKGALVLQPPPLLLPRSQAAPRIAFAPIPPSPISSFSHA